VFTPLKQKIQQGKNRIDTTKGKTHAHEPCEDKCLRVGRVYFEIFLFLSTQRSFISFQFRLLLLLFSFFDHYISFNLRITLMTWKPRNPICVFLLFITTTKENIHKRDVNKDFFFRDSRDRERETTKKEKTQKMMRRRNSNFNFCFFFCVAVDAVGNNFFSSPTPIYANKQFFSNY